MRRFLSDAETAAQDAWKNPKEETESNPPR